MEDGVQHSLGTFDDLVMPCGLMNAPAVFQASVNDVLRDFLSSFFGCVSRWHPHFLPEPSDHILRSPGSPKALHQGQEMRVSRQKCTFVGRHHRERVGEDASRKGFVYCGRGCLSSLYCVRLSSSLVWKAFCPTLGATVCLLSGFHSQTNGRSERGNQDVEAPLRCDLQ